MILVWAIKNLQGDHSAEAELSVQQQCTPSTLNDADWCYILQIWRSAKDRGRYKGTTWESEAEYLLRTGVIV